MNNELIERIDEYMRADCDENGLISDETPDNLLTDCKVGIERLVKALYIENIHSIRNGYFIPNSELILESYGKGTSPYEKANREVVKTEYENLNDEVEQLRAINASLLSRNESLDAECARLEKTREYVPIAENEIIKIDGEHYMFTMDEHDRRFESAIIKRAGLVVREDV